MSRPPDQTVKCLKRDLDWLARIRKRARDNETRSEKKHAIVLSSLKIVMDVFQDELDVDARSLARREARTQARLDQRNEVREAGE